MSRNKKFGWGWMGCLWVGVAGVVLSGCGNSNAMSKSEGERLKSPAKAMPAEAVAYLRSHQGLGKK